MFYLKSFQRVFKRLLKDLQTLTEKIILKFLQDFYNALKELKTLHDPLKLQGLRILTILTAGVFVRFQNCPYDANGYKGLEDC